MQVVGLAGHAQSGKNTAAEALIAECFEPAAFADALRELLEKINPWVDYRRFIFRRRIRLNNLLKKLGGWDAAKTKCPEVRRLLQGLGQGARDVLGPSVWVDAMLRRLDHELKDQNVVITDVRYPNEVEAIRRRRGGVVLRINRPGVGPLSDHPSETQVASLVVDGDILNDGSYWSLADKVLEEVNRLCCPTPEPLPSASEQSQTVKHPLQPLVRGGSGRVAFKQNQIVVALLDIGPLDMNKLMSIPFSDDDRLQFAQLLGLSVPYFRSLPYVPFEEYVRLETAEKEFYANEPRQD